MVVKVCTDFPDMGQESLEIKVTLMDYGHFGCRA